MFYPNGGLRIFKRENKGLRYKHNSTGYTSKKTQQWLSNGIGKYKWIFRSGDMCYSVEFGSGNVENFGILLAHVVLKTKDTTNFCLNTLDTSSFF